MTKIKTKRERRYIEHGDDFASTSWRGRRSGDGNSCGPIPGRSTRTLLLTAAKEERWKKWIGLYNQKMLSKGEFRDLYVTGSDVPKLMH